MQIDDQKGLRTGQLRIAVVTTANYFAPRLLGRFCSTWPGIKVALEVTNREHILDRMANNRDDLYLIGKPPASSELEFQPYLMNPMVVVAPAGHRLAGRKALSITEIADELFILREQGSGTRIALEQKFAEAGHALKVRVELGSNQSIKQGITGGLGIAVLSLHTLTACDMKELTVLDVQGFPIPWQWSSVIPAGSGSRWSPKHSSSSCTGKARSCCRTACLSDGADCIFRAGEVVGGGQCAAAFIYSPVIFRLCPLTVARCDCQGRFGLPSEGVIAARVMT